jgi:hypothetical protein
MKNQTIVNGAAAPAPQPTIDPPSQDSGGQVPIADSPAGTAAPADPGISGGASGTIHANSVKGGHD